MTTRLPLSVFPAIFGSHLIPLHLNSFLINFLLHLDDNTCICKARIPSIRRRHRDQQLLVSGKPDQFYGFRLPSFSVLASLHYNLNVKTQRLSSQLSGTSSGSTFLSVTSRLLSHYLKAQPHFPNVRICLCLVHFTRFSINTSGRPILHPNLYFDRSCYGEKWKACPRWREEEYGRQEERNRQAY